MDCCSDNGGTGTFNFLIISWLILGCPPPNDDNSNSSLAKLLQKSEMRKDIVIELSYKGFG